MKAAGQLALAVRRIQDGGTVVARFTGRLIDQLCLFELVALVGPWFDQVAIVRPALFGLYAEGYLVLKRYRGPRLNVDHFKANLEMVLAQHDSRYMVVFKAIAVMGIYNAAHPMKSDLDVVTGKLSLIPRDHNIQWEVLKRYLSSSTQIVTKKSVLRGVSYPSLREYIVPLRFDLEGLSTDAHLRVQGRVSLAGKSTMFDWGAGLSALCQIYRAKINSATLPVAALAKQVGKIVGQSDLELSYFKVVYGSPFTPYQLQHWEMVNPVNSEVAAECRSIVDESDSDLTTQGVLRILGPRVSKERLVGLLVGTHPLVGPDLWGRAILPPKTPPSRNEAGVPLPDYLVRGGEPLPKRMDKVPRFSGVKAKYLVEKFVLGFERFFCMDDLFEGLYFTGAVVNQEEIKMILSGMVEVVELKPMVYEIAHLWPNCVPENPHPVLRCMGNLRTPFREKKALTK